MSSGNTITPEEIMRERDLEELYDELYYARQAFAEFDSQAVADELSKLDAEIRDLQSRRNRSSEVLQAVEGRLTDAKLAIENYFKRESPSESVTASAIAESGSEG